MRGGVLLWLLLVCSCCYGQRWQPEPVEPLGPSSLRSSLIVSEIMHSPPPRMDSRNAKYIELYNSDLLPFDLTGYRLSGEVDFAFPDGTILGARSYTLLVAKAADIRAIYGLLPILGEFSGTLGGTGVLRLRNGRDEVVFEVSYSSQPPWPTASSQAGHSLALAHASLGESNPEAWAPSQELGGSPGRAEPSSNDPLRAVVINELLSFPEPPELDYVELFNRGDQTLDLVGCILTDHPDEDRFVFGPGSLIPPGGFLALDEFIFRFGFSSESDEIYLLSPRNAASGRHVLDVVRYEAQEKGISIGRYPDGSSQWKPLRNLSPFAANSPPRNSKVVINEINYDPPFGTTVEEFIELHNPTTNMVDVSGWRLADGISFIFPESTTIEPGGFLVIANNIEFLRHAYPSIRVVGNYGGNLANEGERIVLYERERTIGTNDMGDMTIQDRFIVEDEVRYRALGAANRWSRGGGSSLELVNAVAAHESRDNWSDSDQAGRWEPFEFLSSVTAPAQFFQMLLMGEGECEVTALEVARVGGPNLIANGGFTASTNGWVIGGNHIRSGPAQGEGPPGQGPGLYIRASDEGDTGPNSISAALLQPLAAGESVLVRGWVRWLHGSHHLMVRFQGGGFERTVEMFVPLAGTPGLPNSRAVANRPPFIEAVAHQPVRPSINQTLHVQAQVQDIDGVASVRLLYRIDPGSNWISAPMRDDGLSGDLTFNDGIYSAAIPAQPEGTLIAYVIEASDGAPAPQQSRYPLLPAECLVRFGQESAPQSFPAYRLWMTAAAQSALTNRPVLSREPVSVTFVYNDRLVQQARCWLATEPAAQNVSVAEQTASFFLELPEPFLGLVGPTRIQSLALDPTLQREEVAQWMTEQVGLLPIPRRHVWLSINGQGYGLLAEHRWTPQADPVGAVSWNNQLQAWHEFGALTGNRLQTPTLSVGSHTDLPSPVWMFESIQDEEVGVDYDIAVDSFRRAFVTSNNFFGAVQQTVDLRNWALLFAWEHALGKQQSFGYNFGQHVYLSRVVDQWRLRLSEATPSLGMLGSLGPTSDDLLGHDPSDVGLQELYAEPVFQRLYWSQMQVVRDRAFTNAAVAARLNARQANLSLNNVPVSTAAVDDLKLWIAARRAYLDESVQPFLQPTFISTPAVLEVTNSSVTLRGYGPIHLTAMYLNNALVTPVWTSVTNWFIPLELGAMSNRFELSVQYNGGTLVAVGGVTVLRSGAEELPQGWVVINEIGSGLDDLSDFVELYNRHPTQSFDLSGWLLEGLNYSFPSGTILGPRQFLVVPAFAASFQTRFGTNAAITSTSAEMTLQENEAVRLIRIFPPPTPAQVIDQVRYENLLPWPPVGAPARASLQVIDPSRDRSRVSNWATALDIPGVDAFTPGRSNSVMRALPPYDPIWLTEWMQFPPTSLAAPRDNQGEREPWVELYNSGDQVVSLNGYRLGFGNWAFPDNAVLQPKEFKLVWLDGEAGETTATDWHANFRPNNIYNITLERTVDGHAQVVDYLKPIIDNVLLSYGKLFDNDPTVPRSLIPTPWSSNSKQHFINEWMARNSQTLRDPADLDSEDWLELYNPADWPIDLSGFQIGDRIRGGQPLPAGTVLPPGEFFFVWADSEPEQNMPGRDLHARFRIGGDGDTLFLTSPNFYVVDTVVFGQQDQDVSMGRWPDGSTNLVFMPNPTPHTPNTTLNAPNRTPQLGALNDRTARAGDRISFTAVGTDVDLPPQLLDFSLAGNVPPGAHINPVSGLFEWAIPSNQWPGPYLVTVRLTDHGQPPLSGFRSFKVEVTQPILLQLNWTNPSFELRAYTIPGAVYRLESNDNLNSATWSFAGGPYLADSFVLSIIFELDAAKQRFYRLIQVDSP